MELKNQEGKYLTFSLAGEEYGLDILRVREIIGLLSITKLPEAPPFLRGVINLRGQVIPIIDLRLRFGLPETGDTERTCIIVVELAAESGKKAFGLVADSVSEVVSLKASEIEKPPDFGTRTGMDYIFGIARLREELIVLLDVGGVVGRTDLARTTSAFEARPKDQEG